MNEKLVVLGALVKDLKTSQMISQSKVQNIEETIGENVITSSILLNKFTIQNTRVNFEFAMDCLDRCLTKKYMLDPQDLAKRASNLYYKLASLRSIITSDRFKFSPFFRFFNDPQYEKIYTVEGKDTPKLIKECTLSELLIVNGDRFCSQYLGYLRELNRDYGNIDQTMQEKFGYAIKNETVLDSLSRDLNVEPDATSSEYSLGFLSLLMWEHVFEKDYRTPITVGEIIDVFIGDKSRYTLQNLDTHINEIKTIEDHLKDPNYTKQNSDSLFSFKYKIEFYEALQDSPLVERLLSCIDLPDKY